MELPDAFSERRKIGCYTQNVKGQPVMVTIDLESSN